MPAIFWGLNLPPFQLPFICLLPYLSYFDSVCQLMLQEMIGAMMSGTYCGVTSFIYNWRRVSLFWQTFIHFVLLSGGFLITATLEVSPKGLQKDRI
ncbi:DUF3021 family protein [Sporolactobacillus sp. THM7-4]|nr:DUF3021 family protein [Sporolactobacillus sp. THM7-4]